MSFVKSLRFCLLNLIFLVCCLHVYADGISKHPSSPIITDVKVHILNHPDPDGALRRLVVSLFQIKKGMPFSAEKLEQSIALLKRSNRFESIHVDSRDAEPQFDLIVTATPYPLLKKIEMRHTFPVFQREILKALSFGIGDTVRLERIPHQIEAVTTLYRKQGLIAPIVDIIPKKDPEDGNITLVVDIDKGPFYRLGSLDIRGNHALPDANLKIRMKSWRRSLAAGIFGRFVESDVKEDVEKLTFLYRKKKYADVTVKNQIKRNRQTRTVDLILTITEGPQYRIFFEGNRGIASRLLKKDVTIFETGNLRDIAVRKAQKNIRKRYHLAGYLAATVDYRLETATDNGRPTRHIIYTIDEGPQTIVGNVIFAGNREIPSVSLAANMLTRPPAWNYHGGYSEQQLKDDLQAIRFQYSEKGYRNASIGSAPSFRDNKKRVDLSISVEEGTQTFVRQVTFKGLQAVTREEAMGNLVMKPGSFFRDYMVSTDENVLKALIAAKGHPKVQVTGTFKIKDNNTKADLTYHISEGQAVRLGSIFYQGRFKTLQKVLDREWTLFPGDLLNPFRLLESENNIRNLDIIHTSKFNPLTKTDEGLPHTMDMLVQLEERKPYLFEVSGGYESDRRFFLSGKVADHNLLGMNRVGWVSGEVSEVGYRFESGIRDPRLFGYRIAASFHGFLERQEPFNQSFGIRKAGATLGLEQTLSEKISTAINVKYAYLDLFEKDRPDQNASALFSQQEEPRNVLVTTPRIQFDSRDSFIRPLRGIYSLAEIDVSKGLRNDLDDFIRYRLDMRTFWTPIDFITFALIGRGGYISSYGSTDDLPKDQLFFLGGHTDVRGFKQNAMITDTNGDAVGGLKTLSGSIEVRIGIGGNWEIPLFFDAGWIDNIQETVIESDVRFSAGTGLRYITPIGPIGILYGHKLDRKPGEPASVFHFSLGYTF